MQKLAEGGMMSQGFPGYARAIGIAGCLLALLTTSRMVGAQCAGDCNNDGKVSAPDVGIMIQTILRCGPCPGNVAGGVASGCPTFTRGCVNGDFKSKDGCLRANELALMTQTILKAPGGQSVCTAPTATSTVAGAQDTPTPTLTLAPTNTPTLSPTATKTLQANTPTSTATPTPTTTRTRTPTKPMATPTPTQTNAPGLGVRVFNVGATVTPGGVGLAPTPFSGFFSSLLGSSQGVPKGQLVLSAGPLNANGQATVTLSDGGTVIRTDLSAGGLTLCTRIESCTGTLYCSGGTNADVRVTLDSLKTGLSCIQDGTNSCPPPPPPTPKAKTPSPTPVLTPLPTAPCCSNACEGVCTGSSPSTPTPGGPIVSTPTPCVNSGNTPSSQAGVNPTPSAAGSLVLMCLQRSATVMPIGPCTGADFSSAALATQFYTTGSDTAQAINFCAGSAASPDKVPKLTVRGTPFDCANWTTSGGPGVLVFTIPSEEGDARLSGDGANGGRWAER